MKPKNKRWHRRAKPKPLSSGEKMRALRARRQATHDTITVDLPKEIASALRSLAVERGITLAAALTALIKDTLK